MGKPFIFPKKVPSFVGKVTSVGHMPKAAVVETTIQKWDTKLQRNYRIHPKIHISDPTSALRLGDTVRAVRWPYLGSSPNIQHTVDAIISPRGVPLEQRPQILSKDERMKMRRDQVEKQGGMRAVGVEMGVWDIAESGRLVKTTAGKQMDITKGKVAQREKWRLAEEAKDRLRQRGVWNDKGEISEEVRRDSEQKVAGMSKVGSEASR